MKSNSLLIGEKVQIINKSWHFFTGERGVVNLHIPAKTGAKFDFKKNAELLLSTRAKVSDA